MGVRLAALARRHGWEHIHVHSCADAAHVALFAHLTSGVSYSITLHGPLDDYGPNQREKWRHAKFAIVITERLLHEVRERLSGALPDVVEVAPMGVDVETFSRRAPFVPFDGSGPLRLFSCGRLNPCKGHKYLIAAAKRLRDEGFQATLTIAGDDEAGGSGYRQVLEREIGALGMGEFVTLAGAVDEQRIIDELERAHVFSLASLAEPLGVAIMEAMAMELPVVATRSGGVAELITDGADGILVPPEDSSALAQAIVMLARDPARAQRMGQAARGKVIDRFQATRSAQLLSDNLDGHASRGAQQRGAA
jgi:glycosyltransferase involved in cell wall biosynthesis